MDLKDRLLIRKFNEKSISEIEFRKTFSVDLRLNQDFILSNLYLALKEEDPELLDYTLALFFFDPGFMNSEKYVHVLSRILDCEWHFRHEDIIALLEGTKSIECVEILYNTALRNFKYLEYDNTYSLARKCIHALGRIKTKEATEKLEILARSDNSIIKEKAEKQLYNIK
ncbi:MAG: hypothetical protein KDB99_08420 [Chitinophagaceae bacterium]|nr:hypothetical protein [Chitinophagaceae bacterium]